MKNKFTLVCSAIVLGSAFCLSLPAQNFKAAGSATPVKMHKSVLHEKQNQQPSSAYQGSMPAAKQQANPAKTSNWCITDKVTDNYIAIQSQADPDFSNQINKMQGAIQQWINNNPNYLQQKALKTIPVVVHVVYNNAGENVSDALIYDMINTLNEDFQRLNTDTSQTRTIFKPVAADAQIEFCLAQRDPSNNPTNGITRTSTTKTYFDPDTQTDDMKKNSTGGKDAWNPYNYLNIWIADIDNGAGFGTAGYAYLPTAGMHGSWRDGLVLDNNIGICYSCRTATHEIGHYLGLKHTWGNNPPSCTDDDGFSDTPNSSSENFGCSTSQNTCNDGPGDMVDQIENYMSYADCQNMYTTLQANYMNSVLNTTRSTLLGSQACQPTAPPVADFTASDTIITNGQYVQFFDLTVGGANSWAWNFGGGGTPNTSTTQNPFVQFLNVGTYTVSLTASNSLGSDAETKTSYITVLADTSNCDTINWPFLSTDTSLTVYGCGATCGYVVGTNQYNDVSKAQLFTAPEFSPNTHVTGGLFYFAEAYKSPTSTGKVVFTVWDDNGTAGAPNTVLATDTVDLADIVSDVQGGFLTQTLFNPPVAVSGNYYFGFQMVNFDLWAGGTKDTLALVQTTDGVSASASVPWEQWDTGVWNDFVSAWGFVSNTIFATPYMTDMPASASFAADTTEGCEGLVVNFDASSSANGEEYYWDVDGDDTLDYVTYTPDISIEYSAAGTYSISLWVAGICNGLDSIKRNNYIVINDIPVVSTSATNTSCGTCNGTATVAVTGGTSPLTYLWDDPAPAQTTATSTGLCASSYNVLVTDAKGCSASSGITVVDAGNLTLSISAANEICGNGEGTSTATPAGGTSPFTYLWDTAAGSQATQTATGLSSGTFHVTVTDNLGCMVMTDFFNAAVVNNIQDTISIFSAVTGISCSNYNNGSAVVTPSNATAPYTYLWSSSASAQTDSTATGLSPGNHSVTVTDANGCKDSVTITVVQPAALVVDSITVINALCNGGTGSAQAYASGGTGTISYSWSDGQSTALLTAVAGTYTLIVTDSNSCADTASATIAQPAAVNPTAASTNALCNGICNGTVSASASGGTSPYSFSWSGGLGSGASVDSVCAGTYTVTVTDANNCSATTSAVVVEPTQLVASATGTNAVCYGSCDGTLTAAASGGTTPYSYQWSGAGSTAALTGICAGTYTVTVTDANGCFKTASAIISQPAQLTATISSTGETTAGANDGTANISASGGTTGYTYVWSNGGTAPSINGLAPGNYFVTVTDANGCTLEDSTFVNSAGCTLVLDSVTSTPVLCNGGTNGTATVYVSNGSGNYSYSWSDGQITQTATGLAASSYNITATDNLVSGCKVIGSAIIDQPSAVSNSITVTDPLCFGEFGSAVDTPSGGTSPYFYNWSSGGTSPMEDSLADGNYFITVTDANGCTDADTFTVNEPVILSGNLSSTAETAPSADDGTATASASGGTAPYIFTWSSGQTGTTITGLAPGMYSVTVTDDNGCSFEDSIAVNAFVITACLSSTPYGSADASANNTQITISSCNYAGEYATVTSIASGETYLFSSDEPTDWLTLTDSANNVLMQGTTGLSWAATFSGTVRLHIFFDSLCNTEDSCRISAVQCLTCPQGPKCVNSYSYGNATAPLNNVELAIDSCNWASDYATVYSVVTGNSYLFNSSVGTDWLTITDTSDNLLAEGSAPLSWTATMNGDIRLHIHTDSLCGLENVCRITTILCSSCCPGFSLTVSSTDETAPGANDGTATATASGGSSPYTYLWSNSANTSTITGLVAGTYTVTASDTVGCAATDSVIVNGVACSLVLDSVAETASINCFGSFDGEAEVFASGGVQPYAYNWSNGDAGSVADSLPAGSYAITVTDSAGCEVIGSINLTEPADLVLITSSTDETSLGANDGTASVSATGGTSPYSYLWSEGSTLPSRDSLAAGVYCVTVTDYAGCSDYACVTVNGIVCNLSVSVSATDETALNADDGTADAVAFGGTLPVQFTWNTGDTTSGLTGLAPGDYCVTVTDSIGCEDTACVTVNAFSCTMTVYVFTSDETIAGYNDGTANSSVTGANGAVSYLWNTVPPATTPVLTGLAPGIYCLTVTDTATCSATACDTVFPGLISIPYLTQDFVVSLYPNPAKGNLFIEIGLPLSQKAEIEISNCLGQVVYSTGFSDAHFIAAVKTDEWGAGVFFVTVKTDTGIRISRVLIE